MANDLISTQPLAAYILIDRSGSMSRRWRETLQAVDAYVEGLVEAGQTNAQITVAVFDSDNQGKLDFSVLRDARKARECPRLTSTEAYPRGGTPLYDACVRIAAVAERADVRRSVIAVITDGEENMSREANKDVARAAFDRMREKDWQVVFLGVDFDAFADAESVGTAFAQTIVASSASPGYGETFRTLAARSSAYASDGSSIVFNDADRKLAVKPKRTR